VEISQPLLPIGTKTPIFIPTSLHVVEQEGAALHPASPGSPRQKDKAKAMPVL
jgi:hypothetical protein